MSTAEDYYYLALFALKTAVDDGKPPNLVARLEAFRFGADFYNSATSFMSLFVVS